MFVENAEDVAGLDNKCGQRSTTRRKIDGRRGKSWVGRRRGRVVVVDEVERGMNVKEVVRVSSELRAKVIVQQIKGVLCYDLSTWLKMASDGC